MDEEQGLGVGGDLAWRLSADLKHFKEITTASNDPLFKNVLIMGRRTWESLPSKFRPLPGRINIILTRQKDYPKVTDVFIFDDLSQALSHVSTMDKINRVFIIGGANLYSQAIGHPSCAGLFITRIRGSFHCDVFFPPIPSRFRLKQSSPVLQENAVSCHFEEYSL